MVQLYTNFSHSLLHRTAAEHAEDLAIDDDDAPRRLVRSFDIERIDRNIYRSVWKL